MKKCKCNEESEKLKQEEESNDESFDSVDNIKDESIDNIKDESIDNIKDESIDNIKDESIDNIKDESSEEFFLSKITEEKIDI